jgi:hypothetical protein
MQMKWETGFHPEFEPEFDELPEAVQDEILALMGIPSQFGPTLGRPRADTLNRSKHVNMKELRFDAHVKSLKEQAKLQRNR